MTMPRAYQDLVIDDQTKLIDALVELLADQTVEKEQLRRAYLRVLRLADDARREAQDQCEELWAALSLQREVEVARTREAAMNNRFDREQVA
jgi:hypothetical protein